MIVAELGKLMPNWIIIVAVLCVAIGIALTIYALFRVAGALRQAEDGKAQRDNTETLLLESRLRELAAAQNEIAGRFARPSRASRGARPISSARSPNAWRHSTTGWARTSRNRPPRPPRPWVGSSSGSG